MNLLKKLKVASAISTEITVTIRNILNITRDVLTVTVEILKWF